MLEGKCVDIIEKLKFIDNNSEYKIDQLKTKIKMLEEKLQTLASKIKFMEQDSEKYKKDI